tara:strand:- start:33 stop:233 length:201 start_codon:yes stop_codon:yes gene_type:complete
MITLEQKLESLKAESLQIGKNYNEAKEVAKNCENKLREIAGGMKVLEELIAERNATVTLNEPVEVS